MNNKIKGIIVTGALCLAAATYFKGEAPKTFETYSMFPGHFAGARNIANTFHGGIERYDADLDFDGDNMNDLYIVAQDGTLYHTRSMDLINGKDDADNRTWIRGDANALERASEGKYEAY